MFVSTTTSSLSQVLLQACSHKQVLFSFLLLQQVLIKARIWQTQVSTIVANLAATSVPSGKDSGTLLRQSTMPFIGKRRALPSALSGEVAVPGEQMCFQKKKFLVRF